MKNTLHKLALGTISLSIVVGGISFSNLNLQKAIETVFCNTGGGGFSW